jgi:hypothetical protein
VVYITVRNKVRHDIILTTELSKDLGGSIQLSTLFFECTKSIDGNPYLAIKTSGAILGLDAKPTQLVLVWLFTLTNQLGLAH